VTKEGSDELTVTSEPNAPGVAKELDDRLDAHNMESTGIPFTGFVTICLRNTEGTLRAGAHGWVWATWFYLETLWVDPDLRGQGWGHRLLQDAEAEAERLGATRALLETHDFQARPFYERHGYGVAAEVPDYPPGGAYFVMTKHLSRAA
jgi:ribosomal protein S18 acetylase RimI-like enzyme